MAQFFIGQQFHEFDNADGIVTKSLTNSTSNQYEIVSIFLDYTSGSVVANRAIRILKIGADNVVLTQYLSTTIQAATTNVLYDFGLSSPAVAAVTPTGSTNYSRQNLKPIILSPGQQLNVASINLATGFPVGFAGEEMDVTWEWLINKVGVVA